jgi:DNA invertase Pin-like site-specific DNA recombinase
MYLRVSTDGQTAQNQRRVLETVAERRGWPIVTIYEDNGISGAKGRDSRPGFNAMLKDASRRRFDVLLFWSIDRLGRSTAMVATALAELETLEWRFTQTKRAWTPPRRTGARCSRWLRCLLSLNGR